MGYYVGWRHGNTVQGKARPSMCRTARRSSASATPTAMHWRPHSSALPQFVLERTGATVYSACRDGTDRTGLLLVHGRLAHPPNAYGPQCTAFAVWHDTPLCLKVYESRSCAAKVETATAVMT